MNARAAGREARERVPRATHAGWTPAEQRLDPIDILHHDDEGRLGDLLPMRYKRMSETPFTFFRGAASIMAHDLQSTPTSNIRVQICGDAHVCNFGAYASPERRYVFDLNDFDETCANGAWEWDLKRLAASVAVAGRSLDIRRKARAGAVRACVEAYRERTWAFAAMPVLDVWYARIDEAALVDALGLPDRDEADALEHPAESSEHLYPKLVHDDDGLARIADRPPFVFHPPQEHYVQAVGETFARYGRSLSTDRRRLFERYTFSDAAYKVVGVGSVGTRCSVALFSAGSGDSLFLQIKEARASVYEPYCGRSEFADHGERVIAGQRLMQAATDLFAGWARGSDERTYYVRQLRDLKTSAQLERMGASDLTAYARICGWALARAHAKASGEQAAVAGYLGRSDAFDEALAAFAEAYADQNERDHAALLAAIAQGRVVAAP